MTEEQYKARIAELEAMVAERDAKIERLENPEFPKAATGCGALLYYCDKNNVPHVLFSKRGTAHGEGTGISGGGFFEIKKASPYVPGEAPLRHWQECYRELCEEFRDPGQDEDKNDTFEQVMAKATLFTSMVPVHTFERLAFDLDSFVVATPKDPFNAAHDCKFFGYEVTEEAAKAIMAIPSNDERPETVAVAITSVGINFVLENLFHQHEAEPIMKLVKRLRVYL